LNKLLLVLTAALAFAVAACGPGGEGDGGGTQASNVPQITGPMTTGGAGSSMVPLESDDLGGDDGEDLESPGS
jgi:hypothetical protein